MTSPEVCITIKANPKWQTAGEDELFDSSGSLSVVSDEDFEVSGSSEDSVSEDELEIEHGSAISRPLSGKRKSSITEDRSFT